MNFTCSLASYFRGVTTSEFFRIRELAVINSLQTGLEFVRSILSLFGTAKMAASLTVPQSGSAYHRSPRFLRLLYETPLPLDTVTNTSAYHTSFSLFNDLPLEIRRTIWLFALPPPRVVHLQLRPLNWSIGEWHIDQVNAQSSQSNPNTIEHPVIEDAQYIYGQATPLGYVEHFGSNFCQRPFLGFRANTVTPQILFVCREAHLPASENYIRGFTTQAAFGETYFDYRRDTIYISDHDLIGFSYTTCLSFERLARTLLGVCDRETLGKIENLALTWDLDFSDNVNDDGTMKEAVKYRLAQLLRDVFKSLKRLTLVVAHHESEVESKHASVSFIDPLDLTTTCYRYDTFQFHPLEYQDPPRKKQHSSATWPKLDLDALRLKAGLERLPEIEYKIAIAAACKTGYETLRDEVIKQLERNNAVHEGRTSTIQ